ncbi:MAG: hypothetical protein ACR2P8_07410 [Myxococcota bacterium]
MRRRSPVRRGAALALLLAVGCAGASSDPWDLARLEREHPALAAVPGHRLRDVRPYALAASGRLTFFLCRWPDGAKIPLAIAGDATPEERRAIERALAAWEGAGLGIAFARRERLTRPEGVEIRVIDDLIAGGANTIADCAVGPAGLSRGDGALPARIAFASVHLARGDPRLTGSALHELGHALGFQGHPRRGDTVMAPGVKAARLAGERVRAGELSGDPALSALYAVPSGTVLARRSLPPERTRPFDRLAANAGRAGWSGPFARVGDEEGRLFWRDARGDAIAFTLTGLTPARQDPRRLVLTPNARARRELERLP